MKLHLNKPLFNELIEAVADKYQLSEEYIEKDYYASLLLKNIVDLEPETIFKGGTSLSKCHRIINRFSEDIDLNFKLHEKVTQGERKRLSKMIKDAIENAGLTLTNVDSIRSKQSYNAYKVSFPTVTPSTGILKDELVVEYYLFLKSFPCEKRIVNDYISDYLLAEDEYELISEYELGGFETYVQKVERTFMDKLFAICDYYEREEVNQLSRHLYDLHMIWNNVELDEEEFGNLFKDEADERCQNNTNLSASDQFPIRRTLQKIVDEDFFKTDYHNNTVHLLFDRINYHSCVSSLQEIINSSLIPEYIETRIKET